jgi:hypothetical protein
MRPFDQAEFAMSVRTGVVTRKCRGSIRESHIHEMSGSEKGPHTGLADIPRMIFMDFQSKKGRDESPLPFLLL